MKLGRKLVLQRETVRLLTDQEMGSATGGDDEVLPISRLTCKTCFTCNSRCPSPSCSVPGCICPI